MEDSKSKPREELGKDILRDMPIYFDVKSISPESWHWSAWDQITYKVGKSRMGLLQNGKSNPTTAVNDVSYFIFISYYYAL